MSSRNSELVTTAAIHPNVIAGETPTLSPFARASPSDLEQQHELGQFLTPNPIAEFMASPFEIPRSEVHLLDAGAGAGALSAALVGQTRFVDCSLLLAQIQRRKQP